jgi:DNA repair protein RadC
MSEAALMASSSVLLHEFPEEDRPRERLRQVGPEQMSNAELLAILLRTGSRGRSAVDLAELVLKRFGSIRELLNADLEELTDIPGVGLAKAAQLKAAIEVGRRIARFSNAARPRILSAQDAADYMMDRLRFQLKEHFVALHLDAKRRLIGEEIVSVGSLDSTVAHPREIFKTAIKRSAAAIICLHNHPSGDPTPSYEDLEVTRRLVECGQILGVDVLDHIVIGSHSYCSMREKGWLD